VSITEHSGHPNLRFRTTSPLNRYFFSKTLRRGQQGALACVKKLSAEQQQVIQLSVTMGFVASYHR